MLARTIDNGSAIVELRAFGPPDVIALDQIAGNASRVYKVSRFREVIEAVTCTLTTDATVANRTPRLELAEEGASPFAVIPAGVAAAASLATVYSFVADLGTVVGVAGARVATPLPAMLLAPGNLLTFAVGAGVAGDTVGKIVVRRQRYVLVDAQPRWLYDEELTGNPAKG